MVACTPSDVEDLIIRDYRAGHPVKDIARLHRVSVKTIYNILRGLGVPRRRRSGARRKDFTLAELERVSTLRRDGYSKQELADEFHAGLARIDRALRQLGLHERMRRRDATDRKVTAQGYVYVTVPRDDPLHVMAGRGGRGYVLEHRLVMARSLGRPLLESETVHHINGDRSDNKLENLQLRQGKHGKGVTMTCNACGSHDIRAVQIAEPVAT